MNARDADVLLAQGIELHQGGRLAEAEEVYQQLLAIAREHPGALHLLGVIRQQQGRHDEALALIARAIAGDPRLAVYHNNHGAALLSLGRAEEARESFERAIAIRPRYADALANLGMAEAMLDRLERAMERLEEALAIDPQHRDARKRMVRLLERTGRNQEAVRMAQETAGEVPSLRTITDVGNALLAAGQTEDAAEAYRKAIRFYLDARRGEPPARQDEDLAKTHYNLALACDEIHHSAEAQTHFERAAALSPKRTLWRLRAAICGPVVFEDQREIDDYCAGVERSIHLAPPDASGALDEIVQAAAFPGFAFSYHGRNQRRLKEQFAAIYEPWFRDMPACAGSGNRDRLRVGILVTRRHEGMFLKSMRGIVERLDAERVEPVVLGSRAIVKTIQAGIHRPGLRVVPFDDSLPDAARQIREVQCDLIYYWEVGSDSMNYFLPFGRLAPVQCTGWGSTITSGVPSINYFMSSELVESPDSQDQYTERLWKSRTLFRYQDRLPPTRPATPGEFGLPEGRRLYLCPQNPLKLHPDFDALAAGILAADPKGLIVLAVRQGHVADLLRRRFARRIPQADRIVFVPRQSFDDYCRLLQLADVVLDPPHYGAGSTCYDLFSYNLPVVTWPGELIVGRVTQGCYRKMGVMDLVVDSAEKYVAKAVQVATDRDYRRHVVERIAASSEALFNDLEAVRECERFFTEATADALQQV